MKKAIKHLMFCTSIFTSASHASRSTIKDFIDINNHHFYKSQKCFFTSSNFENSQEEFSKQSGNTCKPIKPSIPNKEKLQTSLERLMFSNGFKKLLKVSGLVGGAGALAYKAWDIFYDRYNYEEKIIFEKKNERHKKWQENYKPLFTQSIYDATYFQLRTNASNKEASNKQNKLETHEQNLENSISNLDEEEKQVSEYWILFHRTKRDSLLYNLESDKQKIIVARSFVKGARNLASGNFKNAYEELGRTINALEQIPSEFYISEDGYKQHRIVAVNMQSVAQYKYNHNTVKDPIEFKKRLLEIIYSIEAATTKFGPFDPYAHINLAYAKIKLIESESDQNEKARLENEISQHVRKCEDLLDNKDAFYNISGLQEISRGNYQLAVHMYDEALKIEPDHPVYLYNRSKAYSKMGEKKPIYHQNSYTDIKQAHEIRSDDCNILTQHIMACANTSKCVDAKKLFDDDYKLRCQEETRGWYSMGASREEKIKKVEKHINEKCKNEEV